MDESKPPPTPNKAAVFAAHVEALAAKYKTIDLPIGPRELICLVSLVRLALNHPMTAGPAAHVGRVFIGRTIETLERLEPGIGQHMGMGRKKAQIVLPDGSHPTIDEPKPEPEKETP